MTMKNSLCVSLALCVACGGDDSSGDEAGDGTTDASTTDGPTTDAPTRCV